MTSNTSLEYLYLDIGYQCDDLILADNIKLADLTVGVFYFILLDKLSCLLLLFKVLG